MALRVALVAAVLGAAALLYTTGFLDVLEDPDRVRRLLRDLGGWGYVLYVVSFALLEPFGIPGILFVAPAAVVWPAWLAFALSLVGSVGAGIVGFGFARYLARDWVSHRLPARFHRYDQALARQGLRSVILVRLIFFLAPPAHWVLGLSRVRFAPFVLGSAIGFIPGIGVLTLVGGPALEWLWDRPPSVWVGIGLALALGVWIRRRRRAAATPTP